MHSEHLNNFSATRNGQSTQHLVTLIGSPRKRTEVRELRICYYCIHIRTSVVYTQIRGGQNIDTYRYLSIRFVFSSIDTEEKVSILNDIFQIAKEKII